MLKYLDFIRDINDTLVIIKLDKIAKIILHSRKSIEQLKKKGMNFFISDQHADAITIYDFLTFQILSSADESENKIRQGCRKEGLEKTKKMAGD